MPAQLLWEEVVATVMASDDALYRESWSFELDDGLITLTNYRRMYRTSPTETRHPPDTHWDCFGDGKRRRGWLEQPPEVPAEVVNRIRQVLIDRVNTAPVVVGAH